MINTENIQHNVVKLQVARSNKATKTRTSTLNDIAYNTSNINSSTDEQIMRALDGKNIALKSFLRDLVNEHADKDQEEGYHLWSHTLFTHDRKIILSHLVDADEMSHYCSSPERLDSGFVEYDKPIQHLLDDMCAEVYQDDKESVFDAGCDRYKETLEDGWFDQYR